MGRVWFPSNVPNLPFHHWSAGAALATSIAHKGAVAGVKALTTSVIDYLQKPDLLSRTKESFKREIGGVVYEPLLPTNQQPPVELMGRRWKVTGSEWSGTTCEHPIIRS
jgi:aminobenzoyl-glutamate utilization protein B